MIIRPQIGRQTRQNMLRSQGKARTRTWARLFLLALILICSMCRFDDVDTIRRQAQASVEGESNGLCFLDGGVDILTIRATSYQETTYCRLSNLATVSKGDIGSQNWDIGALRFGIYTNSGISHKSGNPGGQGGGCLSSEADFAKVRTTDCTSFMVDQETTTTGVGGVSTTIDGNPLLSNWYDYDFNQHVLNANKKNFLLRSGDDASVIYKIQFLDYYSSVGTPGYVRFRFARL